MPLSAGAPFRRSERQPTGAGPLGATANDPFRNITISNIVLDDCRRLALETANGAQLEDVRLAQSPRVPDTYVCRIKERSF